MRLPAVAIRDGPGGTLMVIATRSSSTGFVRCDNYTHEVGAWKSSHFPFLIFHFSFKEVRESVQNLLYQFPNHGKANRLDAPEMKNEKWKMENLQEKATCSPVVARRLSNRLALFVE